MPTNKFVDDDRFDGLYMNVASTAHGIEPLLDTVFSFLRRKTDFFAGPPGSTDGTEAAMAKVNQVLKKHADIYVQEHNKPKKEPKKAKTSSDTKTKKTKDEDEIIEMGNDVFCVS